jgi:hypothetical protein
LQGDANPAALAEHLRVCLEDPAAALAAQDDAAELYAMLGGGMSDNSTPADWLLDWLK